jgi:RNA polymerase sigma-70 factor (ECF subfamily)
MDRTEVEKLYRQYGPSVYRRAMNLLRSDQEAQEAMQDVFISVLSKGESFRGASSPMTWLYSVTTNLCLNRIRNAKRRTELLQKNVPAESSTDRPHPEIRHIVLELLRSVPEELARVAVYYFFDDMTHEEIAKILGCSRRTVGDLLERFRKQLASREVEE